jgi:S1-C subfamily serine protease
MCGFSVGMQFDASSAPVPLGIESALGKLVSELGEDAPPEDTGAAARQDIAQAESKLSQRISALKKTNWQALLEERRDGVVQLAVVQENFLWSKGYRQPILEEIFGSGWFIDNREFGVETNGDLLVVTNAHVAKQAKSISVLVPSLGQEPIEAKVMGCCVERDIALLKIVDKKGFLELYKQKTGKDKIHQATLGDSDVLKRGQDVMAVGFPLGMQSVKATMGIVSGYQQFANSLYLSMTAAINPGNSGGPLFNADGQCVGINSAKFAKASGIAFTIPSKQLKVMLDALYTTREVRVPDLGYNMSPGTEDLNEYLTGLKSSGGVYVKDVVPGGLFHTAGVKSGDLLLAVNGHKLSRFGKAWMEVMKDRVNVNGLLARVKWGSDLKLHIYRSEFHLTEVRNSRATHKTNDTKQESLTSLSGANGTLVAEQTTALIDRELGSALRGGLRSPDKEFNNTKSKSGNMTEIPHLADHPHHRDSKGKLLRLSVKYEATPKPAIRKVLEPIIDPPKFVIFGGAVFMELTANLVNAFLEENPAELVEFTQPQKQLEPRILISNIIPGSVAAEDKTLTAGSLLKRFNGKEIKSFKDVCRVVSSPPASIWSIETESALAVLPVDQVMQNSEHNNEEWCDK